MARAAYQEVVDFAVKHQGEQWGVTSIDAYRYKDTGAVHWIVFMQRKPDVYFPGEDSQACLFIGINDSGFFARPVEKQRLFYNIATGERKRYPKRGKVAL